MMKIAHTVRRRKAAFLAMLGIGALNVGGLSGVAQAASPPTFVQVNGSPRVYVYRNGSYHWIPSAALFKAMGGNWSAVQHVTQLSGSTGSSISLIQLHGHPAVYQVAQNRLHWIRSAALLHQLGYHWRQLVPVTSLPFPIGSPATAPALGSSGSSAGGSSKTPSSTSTFVQPSRTSQVYVYRNGSYHWVPSAAVFTAMGGSWNAIQHVGQLPGPVGSTVNVIQQIGQPKVYQIRHGALRWISSAGQFHQLGYHWHQVVPVYNLPYPVSGMQPSLAQAVASQGVASQSAIQANLNNPQVLGTLHWNIADTDMVRQTLGSYSASASSHTQYAETFLYATLANNVSVFNSADGYPTSPFKVVTPIQMQGVPTNIAHVGVLTMQPAQISSIGMVYPYVINYTTTQGQTFTNHGEVTLQKSLTYPNHWRCGGVEIFGPNAAPSY